MTRPLTPLGGYRIAATTKRHLMKAPLSAILNSNQFLDAPRFLVDFVAGVCERDKVPLAALVVRRRLDTVADPEIDFNVRNQICGARFLQSANRFDFTRPEMQELKVGGAMS